jgi:hypothetical protein
VPLGPDPALERKAEQLVDLLLGDPFESTLQCPDRQDLV